MNGESGACGGVVGTRAYLVDARGTEPQRAAACRTREHGALEIENPEVGGLLMQIETDGRGNIAKYGQH
jgi:hypothetical protein